MKVKKKFVCSNCGYTSLNWIGKCPECLSWNTFIEEIYREKRIDLDKEAEIKAICNADFIKSEEAFLLETSNDRVNAFFGEGIIAGSVILLTGEPGVGKSTFLLYLASILDKNKKKFYFSGEESINQIKKRINRLNIQEINLFVSNENNVEKIIEQCKKDKPDVIFIDSIQTCFSSEVETIHGTITQIKQCSSLLIQFAKQYSIPIIITGHVTKSGDIAGPKLMEHMVDVVVVFESEFNFFYRVIRSIKNRYGSIDEILIFELKENGLRLIEDVSGCFIEGRDKGESIGKCKTILIEGRYPIICEIEALVVPTIYSMPRRISEGVDSNRIACIAAILDKHLNEKFSNYDIYFNISGGLKTKDVGIDLAIAVAMYSSKNRIGINNNIAVIGELSLTGKTRNVIKLENRIKEGKRFGLDELIVPENNIKNHDNFFYSVSDINSAIKLLFTR